MEASIPRETRIRACQWGAFDVANYGDQLFPLITREELTKRLPNLELTCFAPTGQASLLPPGSPPLFPLAPGDGALSLQRRDYFVRHFDAILIGGGDLLRFDLSESGYGLREDERPTRPYHAFLDPLWGDNGARPNIFWNAPGVPFPFGHSRRLLVRRACSYVRYLAVRDEVSRGYLLEAGVEEPIHVVPDTGILLDGLIRHRIGEAEAHGLLERQGVKMDGRRRRLLCFQCSRGSLINQESSIAQTLTRVADKHDLEVVLLPVGLGHGDLDALRLVRRAGGNRFPLVEGVESPLEIGAVIGACDYFVGSSLHGNLTALSFGIPHVVANPPHLAKLEGFVQLARLEEFRITGWDTLEPALKALVSAPRERWSTARDDLKARVSEHFDRLADLISRAAAERRGSTGGEVPPAFYPNKAADGDVLLEAYSMIVELHERLEDEKLKEKPKEKPGKEQLEERDRTIRELSRKLRNFERVQSMLQDCRGELAEKNREATELAQELAKCNRQLADLERSRGEIR